MSDDIIPSDSVKIEFKVADASGARTITFSKVVPIGEIVNFFGDAGNACDRVYNITSASEVLDVCLPIQQHSAIPPIRAIRTFLKVGLREAKDAYEYWLHSGKPFMQVPAEARKDVERCFAQENLTVKFSPRTGRAYLLETGQINPLRG